MSQFTFPPATESVTDLDRTIPAEALNIAGAALDAGIFYESEFKAYVAPAWAQAFPVTPKCITAGADGRCYVDEVEGDFATRKAQFEALKERLRSEPRGAWAMVRRPWKDEPDRASWAVAMSMGNGEVACPDLSGIRGQPMPEEFIQRAVGYEVYCSRKKEEARRAQLTSLALIRERGWMPGTVLRDISLGGSKRYSTAKIVKIEGPMVSLYMTRRGSGARWEWSGLAQYVEHASYPPIAGRMKLVVSASEDAAAA
jgi:hypothetical protein